MSAHTTTMMDGATPMIMAGMTPMGQAMPMIMAGVSRVSLELQANQGYSLESQPAIFRSLGEKYRCVFPTEFMIEDAGFSGDDFSRPSIKRIKALARAGKIQGVAFTHLDRFARNVEGGLRLIREFREAGLQVLLGNIGWVTDERNLKIQIQLGLIFAEMMKDEIAEKSRAVVRFKVAEKKQPHGGKAPYGLRFITKAELAQRAVDRGEDRPRRPGNAFERVEANMQLARRIFELADLEHSQRDVCRIFMAEGIKPPSGCRACKKAKRPCTHWNPTFISQVLSDEFYVTGIWHYNKRRNVAPDPERIRNKGARHRVKCSTTPRPRSEWMECYKTEPIISRELFDRVQQIVATNKSRAGGRPSDQYLLSTLCKCRKCGSAVVGWKKSAVKYWYRCSKRDRVHNQHLCDQISIQGAKFERTVLDALRDEIGNEKNLTAHVERSREELLDQSETEHLDEMRAEADAIRDQMRTAYIKSLDERDPELRKIAEQFVAELRPRVEFLEGRIRHLERVQQRDYTVNVREVAEDIRAAFRTKDREEQRMILRHWVSEILYADGEIEITIRVPLAGAQGGSDEPGGEDRYCKTHVHVSHSFAPIKIKRLAA